MRLSYQRGDITQVYLSLKLRFCGLGKVLLNPQWRFLRGYVLRLGFLDGWRGLVFALIEANYVRRKYLQLYMMSKGLG